MMTAAGESIRLPDELHGRRAYQLTSGDAVNHHLYFLTSSLTRDERQFIFCSYRTGRPEYYAAGFPEGELRRLTEREGIAGFSGILGPDDEELIYTASGSIYAVDLETAAEREIASFPGASLGECSLSADGLWLVTALRDSTGPGLAVAALDGTSAEIVLRPGRTVIHPQFHPVDPQEILYAQDPAPRIWMVRRDGTNNRRLYQHGTDEFLVHETFLGGSGEEIIVVRWPYSLLAFNPVSRSFRTIAAINAWHIASSGSGDRILCDTAHPDRGILLIDSTTGDYETICRPGASCGGSQWLRDSYALAADFAAAQRSRQHDKSLSWMEMKVDTVYGPQWTHPHPSFSPLENWVIYTSDVTGTAQVYAVELNNGRPGTS